MKNKLKYLLLGAAFCIADFSYGKDMVTVVDTPEPGMNVNYPGFEIPSWGYDATGMTDVLPDENFSSDTVAKELVLIPMGAARLRISSFPKKKRNVQKIN